MKYNVTLNSKVYEVEVERGEAILVSVQDVQIAAPVAAPVAAAPAAAAPAPAAGAALSGEPVKAPMPGTILQVKVNVGDAVKAGQVVVVLEAMKMENEIPAPRDGTVSRILVSKGGAVDTGAPLVTLA
jgi:Biotin carboxyl carrier protein